MTGREYLDKLNELFDKKRVLDVEIDFLNADYFRSLVNLFKDEADSSDEEITGPNGGENGST